MTTLTAEECWALLREESVGRLGYRLVDELHVVPVNYVVRDDVVLVAAEARLAAPRERADDVAADVADAKAPASAAMASRTVDAGLEELHPIWTNSAKEPG